MDETIFYLETDHTPEFLETFRTIGKLGTGDISLYFYEDVLKFSQFGKNGALFIQTLYTTKKFTKYNTTKFTIIGINVDEFLEIIDEVNKKTTITLYQLNENYLEIEVTNGCIVSKSTLQLYKITHDDLTIPPLIFDYHCKMESSLFNSIIDQFKLFNYLTIGLKDKNIQLSGKNGKYNKEITLKNGFEITSQNPNIETKNTYCLEDLRLFQDFIKTEIDVELYFKQNFPIIINFNNYFGTTKIGIRHEI